MIDAQRLREVLDYDPETGIFRWKIAPGGKGRLGAEAGATLSGYRVICIDQVDYRAHRLAWLYVYGRWPADKIDHKNRQKSDNRIDNLREATHQQNLRNQSLSSRSTSGVTGVSWSRRLRRWRAYIKTDIRQITLGTFHSKDGAIAARKQAERRYFGEFASIAYAP